MIRSAPDQTGDRLINLQHIRILIADDNQLLRTSLRQLLEQQAEYEVVGEAYDGFEAVRLTQTCRPDVVIMDISMPQKDGLTATAELTRDFPQVRVIMMSAHAEAIYVRRAIRAGAVGYLVKCGPASIEMAITAIARGQTYFDPLIARHVPFEIQGVN